MEKRMISKELYKNKNYLEKRFEHCSDVVSRMFYIGGEGYAVYMIYMDSMVDRDLLEGQLLKSLMFNHVNVPQTAGLDYIKDFCLSTADAQMMNDMEEAVTEVLSGNTLIFGEGEDSVLMINTKSFPSRGVSQAESEVTVRGPKDSFTESLRVNTVLVRRRIRDTRLKAESLKIGVRTKTDVALMYMEDLVRDDVLKMIRERLKSFIVDGVLDSGMLEQLTEKKWYSPFPQFQSTERPDKAASALLEGRVLLVVDNSPMVLLMPTTLNCFFQASDDYYNRWGIVCFTRLLRYVSALIAMLFPGLYIAVANFHPEIFPTSLALSFTASRQGVPFPLAVEIILMELAFEVLREAGIRLPGPMGSTLGIVGGLIIGQAAVDANIVSPVVVIVVALTALAAFTIPNEGFASSFRLVKFFLILTSAFFGILGFVMGALTVLVHLCSLTSFGIPYMMPFVDSSVCPKEDYKDSALRFPLFAMKDRPVFTREDARVRLVRRDENRGKNSGRNKAGSSMKERR